MRLFRVWPAKLPEGRISSVSTSETYTPFTDINLTLPTKQGRELALLVIDDGRAATHVLPKGGSVVVGRDPECDVVIDESSVSRNHVRIDLGETIFVSDLGSRHGTEVDGKSLKIGEAVAVRIGQSFEVGRATLMVKTRAIVDVDVAVAEAPAKEAADPMEQTRAMVRKVAAGRISVLVTGETGVGKEMTAEAVHRFSPRAKGPYVKVNCGALTDSLLASELFGHEKGAFTGATSTKQGLLEAASGGSVFLDEIGELSLSLQVNLLRALEEGTIRRVGGVRPVKIDVRFITATNRDLQAEVKAGNFREDLYYRLAGVTVQIPPLRDRRGEVSPLAAHFAAQAADNLARSVPTFSSDAAALLLSYPWPGNVRQLRNVVERAVLLVDGDVIESADLQLPAADGPGSSEGGAVAEAPNASPPEVREPPVPHSVASMKESVKKEVEVIERQRIVAALEACAGNQTQAAKMLKISRRSLVNRLNAYGIPRPRKGRKTKTA